MFKNKLDLKINKFLKNLLQTYCNLLVILYVICIIYNIIAIKP